ncbi:MAG: hypothetical protein JKX97_09110, partial [Candidatus Lindowbacteria bacterium]|nr:hypothetical protein [Candidatus Lindowbacteria bacterium]
MELYWRFISGDPGLGNPLSGHYDPLYVAISIFIASLAGFTSFSIAERVNSSKEKSVRRRWSLAGAVTMGTGIWAMHFTGMLAFSMNGTDHNQIRYELFTTLLSVLPAILGSGIAIHHMAHRTAGWLKLQIGIFSMALGIGSMHYTGMEAMRMQCIIRYDITLFIMSIVVAHLLSWIAFYVNITLRRKYEDASEFLKIGASLLVGCSVAGMHYTAMAAAEFYHGDGSFEPGLVLPPFWLAIGICVVVSMVIALTVI